MRWYYPPLDNPVFSGLKEFYNNNNNNNNNNITIIIVVVFVVVNDLILSHENKTSTPFYPQEYFW